MTPEQIVLVLETIKMLDPTVSSRYTDTQLTTYISIANASIKLSGVNIPAEKLVLAVSLKTLSMVTLPENSSMSRKKIKDVEVAYYQGQGKSKWDTLFDSLVNGEDVDGKKLEYVGI
ncbi:MAG: hypothetical protein ACRCX2_04975 [Paraclostridium sp.]